MTDQTSKQPGERDLTLPTSFRLPPEIRLALEARADDEGLPVSMVLRRILAKELKVKLVRPRRSPAAKK